MLKEILGIWTFGSNDKVEKLIAGTNEIISGLKKAKV